MENYIKVNQIDENIDFINFAITLSNIDSKSREDMKIVCEDVNFNLENLTSNIQIHSDIVNKIDKNNTFRLFLKKILHFYFFYAKIS